jgi:hypothetical protein
MASRGTTRDASGWHTDWVKEILPDAADCPGADDDADDEDDPTKSFLPLVV